MDLQEFLKRTGISQSELASRCGISYHQITYILRGKTPRLKTALLLSEYSKLEKYKLVDGCIELIDFLCDEDKQEILNLRKKSV